MNNISDLRDQIDTIDKQLLELLNQRAQIVLSVAVTKQHTGQAVYDPNRENEVLDRITKLNNGPLGKGAIEEVFAEIITVCREIQSRPA